MFDFIRGLMVGLALGFGLYWVIDQWLASRLSQKGSEPNEGNDQINALNKTIAALTNNLRDKGTSEDHSEPSMASSAPEVVTVPKGDDSLKRVTSLPPEYREPLKSAGFTTIEQLASASPEQISEALGLQPWDAVGPTEWIREAKNLSGSTIDLPIQNAKADDLTTIDGIDDSLASKLHSAGFSSISSLAAADAESLMSAVEAQPWDMVDTQTWIDQAKGRMGS